MVPPARDDHTRLVKPPGLDQPLDLAEHTADDSARILRPAPDTLHFKFTPQATPGRTAWPLTPEYVPEAQDWSAGWTDVMRAVYEQIPLNEAGEPSSIGSIAHTAGTCRPCLFFFQATCTKGVDCTYCHLRHHGMKKKRIRMSKKVREMQAMMAVMAIDPHSRGLSGAAQCDWAAPQQSGTTHCDWAALQQSGSWGYSPPDWQSL